MKLNISMEKDSKLANIHYLDLNYNGVKTFAQIGGIPRDFTIEQAKAEIQKQLLGNFPLVEIYFVG